MTFLGVTGIFAVVLFMFWASAYFSPEPYGDCDYGFKQNDFVIMHFGEKEEGHIAWIDFGTPHRMGDRLYLIPIENSLRKKYEAPFPIYDKWRLTNCTMATAKDNRKIKKGLRCIYRLEVADKYYQRWLNRLEEIKSGKTN